MAARAFITGLEGLTLSSNERSFLRDARPWVLIIFKRNVSTPDQVTKLIQSFRDIAGSEAPVLIDQEGGRVQRLGPPHWPAYPPGAAYGKLYDRDPAAGLEAARLGARLIAGDLAYGETPGKVAAIGAAIAEGLADGGVLPVLKHIPGHGRANADSHKSLPVVHASRVT